MGTKWLLFCKSKGRAISLYVSLCIYLYLYIIFCLEIVSSDFGKIVFVLRSGNNQDPFGPGGFGGGLSSGVG